jgi:hypothetical protein
MEPALKVLEETSLLVAVAEHQSADVVLIQHRFLFEIVLFEEANVIGEGLSVDV